MSRQSHWDKIYRDKSADKVSWYQDTPDISLALIKASGVSKHSAVIDVGGGASTLVDHLLDRGYTCLSVLDIAATALNAARDRLAEAARKVSWYVADVTCFDPPQVVALWHDRAVFHFLTEAADRKAYVGVLKKTLSPGGYLIVAAFAFGGTDRCSGLDTVQYDAAKLGAELGDEFEFLEQRDEVHRTPGGVAQHFAYFHLRRRS